MLKKYIISVTEPISPGKMAYSQTCTYHSFIYFRYNANQETSHYPKTYPQQTNFGYEQQNNSRPPSTKSNVENLEATKGLNDVHSQGAVAGFVQHDAISYPQNHQVPPASAPNYSWNMRGEHQSTPHPENWNNHSEIPAQGYWQDPNNAKQGKWS